MPWLKYCTLLSAGHKALDHISDQNTFSVHSHARYCLCKTVIVRITRAIPVFSKSYSDMPNDFLHGNHFTLKLITTSSPCVKAVRIRFLTARPKEAAKIENCETKSCSFSRINKSNWILVASENVIKKAFNIKGKWRWELKIFKENYTILLR
jgi:hypothetical protein